MKKEKYIALLLFLFLLQAVTFSQGYYYYKDEMIDLNATNNMVRALGFDEGTSFPPIYYLEDDTLTKIAEVEEWNVGFYVFSDSLTQTQLEESLEELNEMEDSIHFAKIFVSENVNLQYTTDEIAIELVDPSQKEEVEDYLAPYNATLVEGEKSYLGRYIVKINSSNKADYDIVGRANQFYGTGMFNYSEPVWSCNMEPFCANDNLWSLQWGLENTGQHSGTPGEDVDMCAAWDITKGSNQITVAIIDEGVDLTHPDLQANLVAGYDATGGNSNGGPNSNDPHGTHCAGVVAGIDNTLGISGVAPDCRILPIRIAYRDIYWRWVTSNAWLADGIDEAVTRGAKVLSNSWGGGLPSSLITNAINDAVAAGVTVVFAAGNNNNSVSYPANLNNVIAVAATSMCGTRKRSSSNPNLVYPGVSTDPLGTSCDGEDGWGSNFGTEIDVAAPGVKIPTTDLQGSLGYNQQSGTAGDYYQSFGGTSAACPHVAGLAALLLSVDNTLTPAKVQQLIEDGAKQIGGYTYVNGRCNDVGHGRIDAFVSLMDACADHFTVDRDVNNGEARVFKADNYIIANNEIFAGAVVEMRATNSVRLTTGFRAHPNCSFRAYLQDCDPNKSVVVNENYINDPRRHGFVEQSLESANGKNEFGLKVYPNPTYGTINISFNKELEDALDISIININGKTIKQLSTSNMEVSVDMSAQPAGIYIVKVVGDNMVEFRRVMKQ